MDHLPIPINRKQHVTIGFFARRGVYKPGDFFSLPEDQIGCSIDTLLLTGLPHHINSRHANEFLQSWLFFALLSHVLQQNIDSESFIDATPRALHTRSLRTMLNTWVERQVTSLSSPNFADEITVRGIQWLQASKALSIARDFITGHVHLQEIDSRRRVPENGIDPTVLDQILLLSVAVLGETLEQTRWELYSRTQHMKPAFKLPPNQSPVCWGRSKFLEDTMVDLGWCPSRISSLVSSMRLSALYYLHAITEPDMLVTFHKHCTASCCKAFIPKRKQVHRHCEGFCERVYPSVQDGELDSWIEAGLVPLVRLDAEKGLVMEAHDIASEKLSFGAVSHSWTEAIIPSGCDARGSNDRKMHICQIRSLQRTFNKLSYESVADDDGAHSLHQQSPVLFWVDVLCMPRDLRAKSVALNQLKDIYSLAEHIIVWDRNLLESQENLDLKDIGARIRLGHWSTRLWALQEAVLAKPGALCFEIKDGTIVKSADLISTSREARGNASGSYRYCWEAISAFDPAVLKQAELSRVARARDSDQAIRNLRFAMRTRFVDRPEDESSIIANILDIDVAQLQLRDFSQNSAESRMRAFLEALNNTPHLGIPSEIIFWPQGRQRLPGYEWAPRTWLNISNSAGSFPVVVDQNSSTASLTTSGLLVNFPGYMFQVLPSFFDDKSKSAFPERFWLRNLTVSAEWQEIRLDLEECIDMHLISNLGRSDNSQICLILSSLNLDDWRVALLVRRIAERRNGKVLWVKRLCRAFARVETNTTRVRTLESEFTSLKGKHYCTGRALPDHQDWCISGGEVVDRKAKL